MEQRLAREVEQQEATLKARAEEELKATGEFQAGGDYEAGYY